MHSHPRGHILVWTRDTALADTFRQRLQHLGFASSWAAALYEAIAAVKQHFPLAVVGTLDGEIPSLMDLETLLTYLSIGHQSLSLAPIPIWALSEQPARFQEDIARLGLPIRVRPASTGAAGLIDELVASLGTARPAVPAADDARPLDVLLVASDDSEGECLACYLRSRGIRLRRVGDPAAAFTLLDRQPVGAVVAEVCGGTSEIGPLLTELGRLPAQTPVIVITGDPRWLRAWPAAGLPPNVACTLAKPVHAPALEACLRRLLRHSSAGPEALSTAQT